jgi:hypothetical protein
MEATLTADGESGLVFDQYSDADFKFARLDVANQQVVIGHNSPKRGSRVDATFAANLVAGQDYSLKIALKGASLSVMLNDQMLGGHGFNSAVVDGGFGLLAGGSASFAGVMVGTNDTGFLVAEGEALVAGEGSIDAVMDSVLFQSDLAPIVQESLGQWSASGLLTTEGQQSLQALDFKIADLQGDHLGLTLGSTVYLDRDGAGRGWFIDRTPGDNSEFGALLPGSNLLTADRGPAFQAYDLLTVVTHEVGHVLGLDHEGLLSMAGIPDLGMTSVRQTLPIAARTASGGSEPGPDDGWGNAFATAGNSASGTSLTWDDYLAEETDEPGGISWVSSLPDWLTGAGTSSWSSIGEREAAASLSVRPDVTQGRATDELEEDEDWMVLLPGNQDAGLDG